MRKLVAILFLLYASLANALDITLTDGDVPGNGCYNLYMFVWHIARDARDTGKPLTQTIQMIDYNLQEGRNGPLRGRLGQDYYVKLAEFMKSLARDIWQHPEIPPIEIKEITRVNCEAWKGETDQFISFQTAYLFRKQVSPAK